MVMDEATWQLNRQRRQATRPTFDRYWTLDSYNNLIMSDMRERLEALDPRITAVRFSRRSLVVYMQRIDRELLRYDLCRTNELLQFAAARRLTVHGYVTENTKPATLRQNRAGLIEQLWHADDNATFPFEKLPAELRVRMYDLYLDEFPKVLKTPTQPPLARTCRLMRTEVLTIFYRRTTFILSLHVHRSTAAAQPYSLRFDLDSTAFIETLAPEHLARIERLQFNMTAMPSVTGDRRLTEHGKIVISLADLAIARASGWSAVCSFKSRAQDWNERASTETAKVISSMESKDGRGVLTIRDVYALRTAFEAIWR
ncbi:hypothetical protein LTS10_007721 [Elasticomyces elasticus]|nr:hypothetical protein LTS10_007721 [Elasticomyces elasticus]